MDATHGASSVTQTGLSTNFVVAHFVSCGAKHDTRLNKHVGGVRGSGLPGQGIKRALSAGPTTRLGSENNARDGTGTARQTHQR